MERPVGGGERAATEHRKNPQGSQRRVYRLANECLPKSGKRKNGSSGVGWLGLQQSGSGTRVLSVSGAIPHALHKDLSSPYMNLLSLVKTGRQAGRQTGNHRACPHDDLEKVMGTSHILEQSCKTHVVSAPHARFRLTVREDLSQQMLPTIRLSCSLFTYPLKGCSTPGSSGHVPKRSASGGAGLRAGDGTHCRAFRAPPTPSLSCTRV